MMKLKTIMATAATAVMLCAVMGVNNARAQSSPYAAAAKSGYVQTTGLGNTNFSGSAASLSVPSTGLTKLPASSNTSSKSSKSTPSSSKSDPGTTTKSKTSWTNTLTTGLQKVLGGVSIGSNDGSKHVNWGVNLGALVGKGNATNTGNIESVNQGGGAAAAMAAMGGGMSYGADLFGTITYKLVNVFSDVKTLLYVLGAFGLVGFAFMAIFGKVRFVWLAAMAFGLAAVAAAGQIIDYATNQWGTHEAALGDTLGGDMMGGMGL